MVRLELLGAGRVLLDNQIVAFPFDKRGALLAYLALQACPVQRSELSALFWLDTPELEARRNLRQLLHRISQLPIGACVPRDDSRSAAPLEFLGTCDLLEWRKAVAMRQSQALEVTPTVLTSWNLPEAPEFMAWLEGERHDTLRLWRALALETADQFLMRGQATKAIELLERVLDFEPLAEDALQLLLLASQQSQHLGRGLAAFEAFAGTLRQEVGLSPTTRTLELVSLLERVQVQPSVLERPIPERIIAPRFFGRDQELAALRQLLDNPETRLLTLTGFGGVGKTRLAKELCPDAIVIKLENVSQPSALLVALADGLGLRFAAHQDAKAQLLNHVRNLDTPILLDNYEQLLPETELIADLLETGARLIVTSREALDVPLEQIYTLHGLESRVAMDLFLERSKKQNPDLEPDWSAIEKIVQILDGMPLALELAATWTRTLSLSGLATALETDTDLLDWRRVFLGSWRRLSFELRQKFSTLAVCVGGFTSEAALALAGATLPDLAVLVRASLLKVEHGRFGMLKLIRQAALKNMPNPNAKTLHAEYYLHWLGSLETVLEQDPKTHLAVVGLEIENLRTAWDEAVLQQSSDLLGGACMAFSTYFDLRGLFFEARQRFLAAVPVVQSDPKAHALMLVRLAWAEFRLGLYPQVQKTLGMALGIYQTLGNQRGVAHCWYQLGNVDEALGKFKSANGHLKLALEVARAQADDTAMARILNTLGLIAFNQGHPKTAVEYHRESLELRRKTNQPRAMFIAQLNLGDAKKELLEFESARVLFGACLQLTQNIGDDFGQTLVLSQLADLDRREGQIQKAELGFGVSIERCQKMGHGYVEIIAWRGLALTLKDLGQLEKAKESALRSLAVAHALNVTPQTNLSLIVLIQLEQNMQNHTRAWQLSHLLLENRPSPPQKRLLKDILASLGEVKTKKLSAFEEIFPKSA